MTKKERFNIGEHSRKANAALRERPELLKKIESQGDAITILTARAMVAESQLARESKRGFFSRIFKR